MSESFNVLHYLMEVSDEMVRFHLGEILFGLGTGAGLAAYNRFHTMRAVRKGLVSEGLIAKIQTTHYAPSIKKNAKGEFEWSVDPKTGFGLIDQKIRIEEKSVRIRDIFNDMAADKETSDAIAKQIEEYVDKAAKHCEDTGNPLVFAHLEKVIPPQDFEKFLGAMSGEWKGFFSEKYRDTRRILSDTLDDNQLHFEKTILPALIWEEGAFGGQFRILMLELNDKGTIDLPPFKDILFKMQDGSFQHNQKSFQDDRYYALKEIKRYLETDEGQAFTKNFSFAMPTGEIITVARPKAEKLTA